MPTKNRSAKKKSSRAKKLTKSRKSGPPTVIDEITTKTAVVTRPKVEIRRAGTLAQALTEPAVAVVKPERKAVSRVVSSKRRVA